VRGLVSVSVLLAFAALVLINPLFGVVPWLAFAGGILALDLVTRRLSPPAGAHQLGLDPPPPRLESPPRVSVVIPALNEADNLRQILPRLPRGLHEVILVDGGSSDGTVLAALATRPSLRVLHQSGRGKGDALRLGFEAVTGDVIVMLDADGSADPAEIPRFVDSLSEGADFAKGSRFLPGGGSADITPLRRAGNWGLVTAVNLLYGTRYTDLCYGYNAFWTSCLAHITPDATGFEVETLINVRLAKAGLAVSEVPSFEQDRIFGQSHLRTFRDGFRVLRTIVAESVLNPATWQRRPVPSLPARPEAEHSRL
jgi:hypothetical protein